MRTPGARFCGNCGTPLVGGTDEPQLTSRTQPRTKTPPGMPIVPKLTVLDESGTASREFPLTRDETVIGRVDADVRFDDDNTVAAEHAVIRRDSDGVRIRDVARGGATWFFIRDYHVLEDGDLMLLGSQVIRVRLLNAQAAAPPGPPVRAGSRVPPNDAAVLEQLLADGRTRDQCFVPEGKAILIGREQGNWVFPYDPTMSARHAEVRSRHEPHDLIVRDLASRNGVGIALRTERELHDGDRILLGRQLLRVDLP